MSNNVILIDEKWQVSICGPGNTVINVFDILFYGGLIFLWETAIICFKEHWALNPVLATLHTLMTAVNSWVQLSYVLWPKPNYGTTVYCILSQYSPYTRVVSWKVYRKKKFTCIIDDIHTKVWQENQTTNCILSFTYLFQIWQLSDWISTFFVLFGRMRYQNVGLWQRCFRALQTAAPSSEVSSN